MVYLVVKLVHIASATLFLGGGILSAYYKVRGDSSGDPRIVAWCQHEIVRADWVFTIPSAVLLPATGLWLTQLLALPLTTPWVLAGMAGYAVAGLSWLPAALLQIRMRALADRAFASGEPLPEQFHRDRRAWFLLGIPSFAAAATTVWVMVAKWAAW